jgi:hypothetical protein
MRDARALLRLTAVVLVAVLALTLAAPARAEADPLLYVGLASIVVIVVIVVVYLVVASSRGPKMPAAAQPVMVACVDSDVEARSCWPVPAASATTAIPAADLRAPLAPMEAVPQS